MSDCSSDCSSCSSCASSDSCSSAKEPESLLEPLNALSSIKRVIAIMSGKGGVGKSSVTASLACATAALGYKVGVLDADITGPSIPQAFGLHTRADGSEHGLCPVVTEKGIRVMSLNLLTQNETDPVLWRGPVIGGLVKQFWTDVVWGDLDYLFIDMPPGTGDVPLTLFQSIPVDGIVVVTTPQDLVSMIVTKAVNMANMMDVPMVGLVENYSYFVCDKCDEKHHIFGESKLEEVAEELGLPILARLPLDPKIAAAVDKGQVESLDTHYLDELAKSL